MRIERFLRDAAARFPDKVALVTGGRRITYAELDAASDRIAAVLAEHGVARGDRVVILSENDWEPVVAIFAAAKAGAAFSVVHPTTKADKLRWLLNNCGARALVTRERKLPVAAEAAAGVPSLACCLVARTAPGTALPLPCALRFEDALERDAAPPAFAGIELDLAMLVYTSGSTGVPKGVMMTHQNVAAAADSVTGLLGNTAEDVILSVLPLSFNYGLYQALMAAKLGATLVLETSFAFPQAILARMAEERATGFPIVPTMAALLLRTPGLRPGMLPHLRYMTNTAAALPPAHIAQLRALFPHARLYSMYGLTESKRCTWLPPEELARRPTSVGIAIPGTEVWVADEHGHPVPHGTVGELVVRGPHVMKGYWGDQTATDRVLRPGPFPWEKVLHTGDLFRADADGFLHFLGRKDDIIKTRGEKVSPKEVEAVLYELPGVLEAIVIGVPDEVLGTALKAVLVPEPGAGITAQAVIRHCARRLEQFMVPKFVEIRAAGLPKTDTGKISRRQVAQALEGG